MNMMSVIGHENRLPSPPVLPDSVLRLARPPVGPARFTEGGAFIDAVLPWKAPTNIDGNDLGAVRDAIGQLDAWLEPGSPPEIAKAIYALLLHYRDSRRRLTEVEEASIAEDWMDDLGDYPARVVENACRTWRRTQKWPPRPCEIIELCETAVADHRTTRDRLAEILSTHQVTSV